MKRTHKGFTLVELLIVVAIVGILATMMTLTAGDSTPRAQAARVSANYKIIGSAVASYIADSALSGDAPTSTHFNIISPDYISAKLGSYKVTSGDASGTENEKTRGKYYWWVECTDTAITGNVAVKEALKKISTDMDWKGFKARIF